MPHAVVMMLCIIVAAVVLTWIIPSGRYERSPDGLVVPGTYHAVPKDYGASLWHPRRSTAAVAYPASPVAVVASIPAGMVSAAALIFMILFIGGMFGVLQETGALAAGIERLLAATRGNVVALVPLLMIALSAGSTFLGLISEYLIVIPLVVALAHRLRLDALFATALVTVAAKIGYMTSVTNPLPLVIAQPIVGVPVFSGAAFRLVTWLVYLALGTWFVLRYARRQAGAEAVPAVFSSAALAGRHVAILLVLLATIALLVYGAQARGWGHLELGAVYILAAMLIGAVGRIGSRAAAHGFLEGMKTMVLAAVLVGLARAVELILRDAVVLDSIVAFLAQGVAGRPRIVVAQGMVFIQMLIDVLIPSTSGQAAVTMPILGPIGQLGGLTGQVTVQAFIFGNGLTNVVTPTSGMLLAYLATGGVSYGAWIRFVWPLLVGLVACSLAFVSLAVVIGH